MTTPAINPATEWRRKNADRARLRERRWYAKNRLKLQRRKRAWRHARREHCAKQQRAYRLKRPEYFRTRSLGYYYKNRDRQLARARRVNSTPRGRIRNADYARRRYKTNPHARFRALIARQVHKKLESQRAIKSAKLCKLLGTTIAGLRAHLESLFKPGMSWANKGQWHIDHVKPCALFDLRDPLQQMECFNYKNLQPLWAQDNLTKGKKYPNQ